MTSPSRRCLPRTNSSGSSIHSVPSRRLAKITERIYPWSSLEVSYITCPLILESWVGDCLFLPDSNYHYRDDNWEDPRWGLRASCMLHRWGLVTEPRLCPLVKQLQQNLDIQFGIIQPLPPHSQPPRQRTSPPRPAITALWIVGQHDNKKSFV